MKKEKLATTRFGGLTWAQIIQAIQTRPTVEVWPYAGPTLGYRSKTAAYDAARKGLIRTIPQGRKCPVPTPWLRQVLGLDETRRWRARTGKRNKKKASDSASTNSAVASANLTAAE
jgi:hypothetical protein